MIFIGLEMTVYDRIQKVGDGDGTDAKADAGVVVQVRVVIRMAQPQPTRMAAWCFGYKHARRGEELTLFREQVGTVNGICLICPSHHSRQTHWDVLT